MISILSRYIARQVILSTLMLILVVAVLAWVVGFLGELRELGQGDYGFFQALWHAVLELPFNVSQFFPMLALLGGLMGLGSLVLQGELVVMRASGLSLWGIVRALILVALLLVVMNFIVGELIAPRLHYLADITKSTQESGGQAVITGSGVWFHQQNDFIHVERVLPHQQLEDVTRYAFDGAHHLLSASHADSMNYQNGQWIAYHLSKTTFTSDQKTLSEHADQAVWGMKLNPAILNASLIEPEEIPLNRLWIYNRHLEKNGSHATEFQFSFWKRIFQPLTILMMLLLSLPFVLVAPRSTMGWRLLTGVIAGFIFYMLDIFIGQLSVIFQFSPLLAALFPIFLFAFFGYVLFKRLGR
ncbi:MAG: LPS export ABC transporter permease LptG [Gammaproteobacteria bacterium]|nr:LPS export ABC transporter permease LptG [Gammaproteobacteria bacterium]